MSLRQFLNKEPRVWFFLSDLFLFLLLCICFLWISQTREIRPTDVFSVNEDFVHRQFKIKVNAVQMKETVLATRLSPSLFSFILFRPSLLLLFPVVQAEEHDKTQERIHQDRQHKACADFFFTELGCHLVLFVQIDASIVRIMKARRAMQHNELVAEVIRHVKFPVQV